MFDRSPPGQRADHLFRIALYSSVIALTLSLAPSIATADDPHFKNGAWPFRPVTRPEPPQLPADVPVPANPIDRFVLAKLQAEGLSFSPPADRRTWLRRVTYDLTGLLPTTDELNRFLTDTRTDAYERVVDGLLAGPRYGEHWATGWLDLVRFAETSGYKIDELRPEAYRYRDYVVRAFNDDLPYDRFIRQQLAGDELEPENPDAIVATGFNRLYQFESNTSNFRKARQDVLDDLTETTGFVFMGLTIGCAKCHDHKFDPISQEDFFRIQAVFSPLIPRDDLPVVPSGEVARFQLQQRVWSEKTASIRAKVDEVVSTARTTAMTELSSSIDAETGRAMLKAPAARTPLEKQLAAFSTRMYTKKMDRLPNYLEGEAKSRYDHLQRELVAFDRLKPAPLPLAMGVTDVDGPAPETHLLEGGNFLKPVAARLEPGVPDFLGDDELEVAAPFARPGSTGRRTAFAAWLTHPDHPLTARVWMNRVWQQHFGIGIVPTANDFGVMGEAASHRELLDWLADEFTAHGWKLKPLQRLIVLSQTYRQGSVVDPTSALAIKAKTADPNNRLLWHFRRQRLTGEAIRDVVLQLSGRLNERMYGPSSKPELPDELEASRYSWEADEKPEDRNRRTIYTFARRNLRLPILGAFDAPDLIGSCAKRGCTITSPQALTLLNGEFTLSEARYWSGHLLSEHGEDEPELIAAAYRQAFHRAPHRDELQEAREFLAHQEQVIAGDDREIDPEVLPSYFPAEMHAARAAAFADFCHALLNAGELSYVD